MKKNIIVFIILIVVPLSLFSQSNRWKRTRYEVVGGIGAIGFMGELGGGKEASHFISDFNFTSQRELISVGMRYKFLERLAGKGTLSFGHIYGNDNKSKNEARFKRNLSFRSPLLELAAQCEYSIVKEQVGRRRRMRRRRGRGSFMRSLKNININTYIFAGVAGFWFNPRGKDDGPGGTGEWVSLQPLGTEGQGLMEGRKKYHRIAVAIPFGVGFKYNLDKRWSIGLEYGGRWTFTDYMDDVSTSYVDNKWLAQHSELAARMADKSNTDIVYEPGGQRGDSRSDDYYMFSLITVTYKLKTGRNGLPKF